MGWLRHRRQFLYQAGLCRRLTRQVPRKDSTSTYKELNMSASEKPLHIDIPVRLTGLRIAFSIADLAFEGDLPASIFHLQLITNDTAHWKAKPPVIAVFHTNAGHVNWTDDSYNAERKM